MNLLCCCSVVLDAGYFSVVAMKVVNGAELENQCIGLVDVLSI